MTVCFENFVPTWSQPRHQNFSNFNRENFRKDISRQDWSCTSDDPNVLWADWKAKFLSIVNSHAPIKTKRVRSGKVPWITSDLRKGMRDRDVAKRKAIKSNNPQDWAMYKRLRNRINGEVKSTKASYYASAFFQSNGDSLKTWQLINKLTSRQKNNLSVKELRLNENSVTNSHELSSAFNDHFSTREDKGDREGIPHTQTIPQVILLELFLRPQIPRGIRQQPIT